MGRLVYSSRKPSEISLLSFLFISSPLSKCVSTSMLRGCSLAQGPLPAETGNSGLLSLDCSLSRPVLRLQEGGPA